MHVDELNKPDQADYVMLMADIVSAYVSNNRVAPNELPALISATHAALAQVAGGAAKPAEDGVAKATSTQIKKSITDETLISFEDGKPYKTLRRHLTLRGLSPETYRAKHGLPADYPMTSAAYSAHRSELAKSLGLGQQRRKSYAKAAPADEAVTEAPKAKAAPAAPKARARKKATAEA